MAQPAFSFPITPKVPVIRACLYDPQMNRTYAELAAHYGTAVLAARPYWLRDRAKVDVCVGMVERLLFKRLRSRVWYGLDELGSGLVDQSQKMTVAARAMADKKTVGHLS
jgi:transposase